MGFDVSTLANYTKENADELVTASVFSAKTQQMILAMGVVHTGVKSSVKVNKLTTDAVFQADSCGFNSSGTTAITQRDLVVGKIKVNEALCPNDLETKYTQNALKQGSRNEEIPFEEEYTTLKTDTIAAQNETAIWKGDTTSGDGNLNRYDGFIKIINQASGSVIHANSATYTSGAPYASGAVITPDVALAIADGMYAAIPAKVIDKTDIRIFCGWDFFKQYVIGLKRANLFHYDAKNEGGELTIPGTQYVLTAVHGLDGTNRLYALRVSNMHLGTDMEGEDDDFQMFWAQEAQEVRFIAKWKLGVQVAFPDEIVEFHLGA